MISVVTAEDLSALAAELGQTVSTLAGEVGSLTARVGEVEWQNRRLKARIDRMQVLSGGTATDDV